MYQKLITIFILIFYVTACANNDEDFISAPIEKEQSYITYQEALKEFYNGQYFIASKKFIEAEAILPRVEDAAKSLLMSSYCLYLINFYDDADIHMRRFIKKYPADKNISYVKYLLAISSYENVLDEKKDISPLLNTNKLIDDYLKEFPNNEYALDLSFKKNLIVNQLAAKEMYIAKYYIQMQKWIPAINRLKLITKDYNETIYIEEALHRLVEVYYRVGLLKEAKSTAVILGYNYNSSRWYKQSYKILNKKYKLPKIAKPKKDSSLIKRTIDKLTGKK